MKKQQLCTLLVQLWCLAITINYNLNLKEKIITSMLHKMNQNSKKRKQIVSFIREIGLAI